MSEDDRESEGLVAIISSKHWSHWSHLRHRALSDDELCRLLDVEVAIFTQKKLPSTHIEVTIDDGPSQKSIVIKKSANPKWLEGDENMTL